MDKLFGSKKNQAPPAPKTLNDMSKEELKEAQRSMQKTLAKEMREMDRQIMQIDMARKKSEKDLEKEVKKGDKADKFIKQTYAKQVITCQKNKERCLQNKGKVQNVQYSLDNMFANIRMAQTMGTAAQITKEINKCMNIKELNTTMNEMQKQMMQMGIVQEQMDEAMENMNEDNDLGDMQEAADQLIQDVESKQLGTNKELQPQQQQQNVNQNNQAVQDDEWAKKLAEL